MPLAQLNWDKMNVAYQMAVSHLPTSSSVYFEKTTPNEKFTERMNQNFLVVSVKERFPPLGSAKQLACVMLLEGSTVG